MTGRPWSHVDAGRRSVALGTDVGDFCGFYFGMPSQAGPVYRSCGGLFKAAGAVANPCSRSGAAVMTAFKGLVGVPKGAIPLASK